ncbi:MAG: DUF72 domain-containing protein [Novosphingobium sp.]
MEPRIRTGIGGWTFPPWRGGVFYPVGLRQADELAFAARAVGAIEINATYHRLQKPASFRAWRAAVPPGFVFTVKGSRAVTNRTELAGAGPSIARFLDQGLVELGDHLGPILWQLMATKRFVPDDLAAFLALLPPTHEGVPLRHAIEVGHASFACAEFVALARAAGVAVCFSDADKRVPIADRTAGFAYARLQRMASDIATGYPPAELERFAALAEAWAKGGAPAGLPYVDDPALSAGPPGEMFLFLINGAKERAPAAALTLAELIGA